MLIVPQPKGEAPDWARGIWGSGSQQPRYWFGIAGIAIIFVATFILAVAAFNSTPPQTESPQSARAERPPAAIPAGRVQSEPTPPLTHSEWSQLVDRLTVPATEKVAEKRPTDLKQDAKAAVSLGLGYMVAEKYDEAIENFDKAVKWDPNNAEHYHWRGQTRLKMRAYDDAIKDYGEAIRLDPFTLYHYCWRGEAWLKKKEYDEAIKDCTEAIRLDPRYAFAYSVRGKAWYGKKEYAKARQDLDEAHRLDPVNYK